MEGPPRIDDPALTDGPATRPRPEAPRAEVLAFPAGRLSSEIALEELDGVYAFIHARVGNRPDAEDLTQQVALKAIPRLREGAAAASVRAYLFATARSVLASFWSERFSHPEAALEEDAVLPFEATEPASGAAERVARLLEGLPENYRRVLELRFLRGYSLKEVAREIGTTVGNVKVMQYRALRRAAGMGDV
ncbi:MAG: RNA polymerase sigma factor [Candidatus Dormibacterales bacterium]